MKMVETVPQKRTPNFRKPSFKRVLRDAAIIAAVSLMPAANTFAGRSPLNERPAATAPDVSRLDAFVSSATGLDTSSRMFGKARQDIFYVLDISTDRPKTDAVITAYFDNLGRNERSIKLFSKVVGEIRANHPTMITSDTLFRYLAYVDGDTARAELRPVPNSVYYVASKIGRAAVQEAAPEPQAIAVEIPEPAEEPKAEEVAAGPEPAKAEIVPRPHVRRHIAKKETVFVQTPVMQAPEKQAVEAAPVAHAPEPAESAPCTAEKQLEACNSKLFSRGAIAGVMFLFGLGSFYLLAREKKRQKEAQEKAIAKARQAKALRTARKMIREDQPKMKIAPGFDGATDAAITVALGKVKSRTPTSRDMSKAEKFLNRVEKVLIDAYGASSEEIKKLESKRIEVSLQGYATSIMRESQVKGRRAQLRMQKKLQETLAKQNAALKKALRIVRKANPGCTVKQIYDSVALYAFRAATGKVRKVSFFRRDYSDSIKFLDSVEKALFEGYSQESREIRDFELNRAQLGMQSYFRSTLSKKA